MAWKCSSLSWELAALLLGWAQAAPPLGTCWSRPAVLAAALPRGALAFFHTACPASARLFFSSFT